MKEGGLGKERICMTQRYIQQCGEGPWKGGQGLGGDGKRGGKWEHL